MADTLSATDPANQSSNRVSASNRRQLPTYILPFGSGRRQSTAKQADTWRAPLAQSPRERCSVPFACFPCITGNNLKISGRNRRFGYQRGASAWQKSRYSPLSKTKTVDRRSTRDLRLLWAKCLSDRPKTCSKGGFLATPILHCPVSPCCAQSMS